MLQLSVPVALAAGVLQISVLMDTGISAILSASVDAHNVPIDHFTLFGHSFRYPMEAGAPVRLNWAQFLYQFPLGIFAIALATAIFPGLSSDALENDRSRFGETLRTGIEATLLEGIAASIGLIIVRHQAVRLFYGYGEVTAHDLQLTANSLVLYSSGIWAYSMQQIINRAYYALHDTKTPFVMSIVNIALNLVVELPLIWTPLGESGMAAGTVVSFTVQAFVMLYLLRSRIGDFGLRGIATMSVKLLLAGGLMYAACWGMQKLPIFPQGSGRIIPAIQLLILITTGAAVYLGTCHLLGIRILGTLVPRKKAAMNNV
jgi:putative peptidoglycan lipid II flippase